MSANSVCHGFESPEPVIAFAQRPLTSLRPFSPSARAVTRGLSSPAGVTAPLLGSVREYQTGNLSDLARLARCLTMSPGHVGRFKSVAMPLAGDWGVTISVAL